MNDLLKKPFFNGFMLGLILPMLFFLIWYELKFSNDMSLNYFINMSLSKLRIPSTLRMCVFANLPFFLLFNFMKRFEVCMGIFASSMIYIILIFGFYWFG